MLLYAANLDAQSGRGSPPWPLGTNMHSSTEYIRAQSATVFQDVSPSFFSAPGLLATNDWNSFDSRMNAWCLNLEPLIETNGLHADTPVVFTRNLHFALEQGRVRAFLQDEPPFGKSRAIVVTANGSMMGLTEDLLEKQFTWVDPDDIKSILRPEAE